MYGVTETSSDDENELGWPPAPDSDPDTWGTPEGRRVLDLLWDPPPPSSRGPRQKLSLDQVVTTAMRIAAEDGVDGLSMRKVASALGVGAMSLYTYVPGRDELFELMIDRAWSDRAQPERALPWREQVLFHARQAWQMYQRHPWLIHSHLWRMPLGPHVLDAQEDLYRAALLSGLSARDVAKLTGLVEAHVFSTARSAITDTSVSARTGLTADEYWHSRASFWGTYYSGERFPSMTRLWYSGAFDGPQEAEQDMIDALELILDGVERGVEEDAGPRLSDRLAAVLAVADPRPGDRVLEVGCGPGALVAGLAHRTWDGHVVGLDRSARSLTTARRSHADLVEAGRISFVEAAVQDAPPDLGTFDLVVAARVRELWTDPTATAAVRDLMSPEGRLVIALDSPSGRVEDSRLDEIVARLSESGLPFAGHLHHAGVAFVVARP